MASESSGLKQPGIVNSHEEVKTVGIFCGYKIRYGRNNTNFSIHLSRVRRRSKLRITPAYRANSYHIISFPRSQFRISKSKFQQTYILLPVHHSQTSFPSPSPSSSSSSSSNRCLQLVKLASTKAILSKSSLSHPTFYVRVYNRVYE